MILLTDLEMAEVQGDKDACLSIIEGFGSCEGCSANCHAIAQAQLRKVVEWGVKECPLTLKAKHLCPECWQELRREAGMEASHD